MPGFRTGHTNRRAARFAAGTVVVLGLAAPAGASAAESVYTANYTGDDVTVLSVGPGGVLTQQGEGAKTGSGPIALALTPEDRYLFSINRHDGTVTTFAVGRGGVHSVAVSPNGRFLYAGNAQQGTVSTFAIGADGTLTQRGSGLVVARNVGALPAHTTTATIGDQRVMLTTPPLSPCQGPGGGQLAISLRAMRLHHGAAVRLGGASLFVGRGVKHGRHYRANATVGRPPATVGVSLAGVQSGIHTLTVKLSYRAGGRRASRSLSARFAVCSL